MAAALDAGTVLEGRFEVVKQVAAGGMGEVYLANDRETGARVAVKSLTLLDEASRARFAREAALLARVRHPSLVRYVSHGATADGGCWLAMEWLEGVDLRSHLGPRGEAATLVGTRVAKGTSAPGERRGVGVLETVQLGRRLAAGLGALHVEGIVHRDVKPANIFLPGGDLGRAKLVDLGTARVALDEASVTRTGLLIGTPMYMSPEQARAESDVDAAADIWALGCVLYECLTGEAPFRGGQLVAILARVLFDTVVPLDVVRGDVPLPLADLIQQMLDKDRRGRPSIDEVARTLESMPLADLPSSSTPVVPAPRAEAALTGEERRVRCVLVARGPGGLEDARATLHDSMAHSGVSTERLAEGSLVITVPGTLPPTDQAFRLARAALLLCERAPQHAFSIAMGRASGGENVTAGEVVERAALVLRRTAAGTISVDPLCRTLLLGRFDLEEGADGARLLRAREREATRTLLGKPTRTVGRRRELSMLRASYEDCVEGERPRAVLVTGHAGMGKSRLRYELVRSLDRDEAPPRWMEAQADALSAGAPFGLLGPALRRAAGVADGGATEAKRAAVRTMVSQVGASARSALFLGELMGVPFDDSEDDALRAGRGDPMLLGESMLAAFVEWTGCAARERPLVFLLEDLHWGDRPSVRYLDAALRAHSDLPILVVAFARPEVHAPFPGLFADHGVEEIKLDALARKAAEELVREALPTAEDALVAALVERSGGHALYLEELIRAVSEGGAGDSLPDSVLGMVQSRLDGLGTEAKRVLRAGSVFGEVFWASGVRALLRSQEPTLDVDEWLTQLAAREVITSRPSERFGHAREFRFRHALVRDGAYETLTEDDRVLGHRLAGEWLEGQGETDAATLATHFARGRQPGRASRWYRRAAEQALEGNDLEGASAALDNALTTVEAQDERGALLGLRATIRYWQSAYEDTRAAGVAALDALTEGCADWFTALGFTLVATARLADRPGFDQVFARGRVAQAHPGAAAQQIVALCRGTFQLLFSGRFTEADATLALIDGLVAAAGDLDPLTLAQHRHVTGVRAAMVGNVAGFLPPLEEAVDYFERAGDERNALLERTTLGWCYAEVGAVERAISALRANLETCRAARAPQAITYAKVNLGYALSLRADTLEEAAAVLRDAILECEAVQNARLEGWARGHLASVLRARGSHEAERAEAALAVTRLEGSPGLRAWTTAILARAELACGRHDLGLEQAERAMAALVTLGGMLQGESLPPLALAEALLAAGHTQRAREAAADARSRLTTRALRFQDVSQREGFLARAENLATVGLEERLGATVTAAG